MNVILDHEQFEGASVLAEIGTKIATARGELEQLEASKEEFLGERAAEAVARVNEVLVQSKNLISEIGGYHNELVGYRTELDGFLTDVRYLIQVITRWKEAFDKQNADQLAQITAKIAENNIIVEQIKGARALLNGESEDIKRRRRLLSEETTKINDEWATIERARKELSGNS